MGTRPSISSVFVAACVALAVSQTVVADTGNAGKEQLRRGKYLVDYGGCDDCHSPKVMTAAGPAPDMARRLSGHPADAQLPPIPAGVIGPDKWGAMTNNDLTGWVGPWGVSFAANLTPDKTTGLGAWTSDQFVKTMRTGKHLGTGRPVLPPMPWYDLAFLTDKYLHAVFAYLKTLKPIQNKVPQPIPPKGP